MNQFDLIKSYMTKGYTPKGIVKSIVGNNPIFNNLINMADKGDNRGVEIFARNLLKERGIDFDKEIQTLKTRLNIQ